MRKLSSIIVHCSATKPDQDIGANTIKMWHVEGNGWNDIGYHYVIRRDGLLEKGRPLSQKGAHAKGYNDFSVGVCLVGGIDTNGTPDCNYTCAQYYTLHDLILDLMDRYGELSVMGHRDLPGVAKACPVFNVKQWISEL